MPSTSVTLQSCTGNRRETDGSRLALNDRRHFDNEYLYGTRNGELLSHI